MKSKGSNKLWLVSARSTRSGYKIPEGDLLILGGSATAATKKAEKWLARHKYYSYKVHTIEYQGEIDIF